MSVGGVQAYRTCGEESVVNVHDQCGVCDDVIVRCGWMGRSSGSRSE